MILDDVVNVVSQNDEVLLQARAVDLEPRVEDVLLPKPLLRVALYQPSETGWILEARRAASREVTAFAHGRTVPVVVVEVVSIPAAREIPDLVTPSRPHAVVHVDSVGLTSPRLDAQV